MILYSPQHELWDQSNKNPLQYSPSLIFTGFVNVQIRVERLQCISFAITTRMELPTES